MVHRINAEIDEEHYKKLKEIRKAEQVYLTKVLYEMIDQKYNELIKKQLIKKIK